MATKQRVLEFQIVLNKDDRNHPGTSLRDVLLDEIFWQIVGNRFKVGSGNYTVSIIREANKER